MNRKEFLYLMGAGTLSMAMPLKNFARSLEHLDYADLRLPALFVGHGNPMNALEDNPDTRAWKKLGEGIRPRAVLCISAHWLTRGTFVTAMEKPKTIHDFYGFPRSLHEFDYPAPGAPGLARELMQKVNYTQVREDHDWGLDHGTWSVLAQMYPLADIPVFQMSIDIQKPMQYHYELARDLSYLRSKGVLVVGSGNIVHNLRMAKFTPNPVPYDWALEFDATAKKLIESGDHQALINYKTLGKSAMLSIPTEDHYIPLIYLLGLGDKKDAVSFPVESMAFGSGSMRSVQLSGY